MRRVDEQHNAARRRPIEVRIDEVALVGFERRHRAEIGAALYNELTRLFNEQEFAPGPAHGRAVLDAGRIPAADMRDARSAAVIGAAAARAVFQNLQAVHSVNQGAPR